MAKILIVDDEHLTLEMLGTYLQLMGHEALEAANSNQALDKLAYEQFDVMLLDIMLPDNNGIDLCRELRGKSDTATLPIIIISAHAPPMVKEALDAGANSYLPKPINLQALKQALTEVGVS